jgi:hypothetical protein
MLMGGRKANGTPHLRGGLVTTTATKASPGGAGGLSRQRLRPHRPVEPSSLRKRETPTRKTALALAPGAMLRRRATSRNPNPEIRKIVSPSLLVLYVFRRGPCCAPTLRKTGSPILLWGRYGNGDNGIPRRCRGLFTATATTASPGGAGGLSRQRQRRISNLPAGRQVSNIE